jgi:outer membrane immunogenic protein
MRMLRCVVALVVAAFPTLFAGAASAQSPQKWNGPYVGANVGYGWGGLDGSITVLNPSGVPYAHGPLNYSSDLEGAFGGIQIGFNRVSGRFFAGIEADFQGADISGSSTTSFAPPTIFPFSYTASANIDWFSTLRGRLGIATNDMLVYVTGGLAIGSVDYSATYLITQNNAYAHVNSSDTRVGYVLGAGMERALRSNWSLKLEYQYLNFGDQKAQGALFFADGHASGETVTTRFDTDIHTVRVGLNYHLHEQQRESLK